MKRNKVTLGYMIFTGVGLLICVLLLAIMVFSKERQPGPVGTTGQPSSVATTTQPTQATQPSAGTRVSVTLTGQEAAEQLSEVLDDSFPIDQLAVAFSDEGAELTGVVSKTALSERIGNDWTPLLIFLPEKLDFYLKCNFVVEEGQIDVRLSAISVGGLDITGAVGERLETAIEEALKIPENVTVLEVETRQDELTVTFELN